MEKKSDLIVEIDHWRLTLNMLASEHTNLTEAKVLEISQLLDELIVEYYKHTA